MIPSRSAGHTLVEIACALAILGAVGSGLYAGEAGRTQALAMAYRQAVAERLAASRLEALLAGSLDPGVMAFGIDPRAAACLPGARAHQYVQLLEPGLYRVQVTVDWLLPGSKRRNKITLTTRIARN
ncbi:MAG: hypothetical protein ACE5F1_07095 [Planctomycetota bacterium]